MAKQGLLMLVVAVVVLSISGHLVDAADDKCSKFQVTDFVPCVPAARPPNPPPPAPACCAQVKAHNDAGDLPCLCAYKDDPRLIVLGVDPALALLIPEKCGVPKVVCP
ncbi:hypothetical protein Syun_006094 [Stephania yunnanensis]|uniref:Bifunctional inhibitor/plant lipid transfer protein/seed storage helical domain-containing protein n=1 Tax=Stephania yunnanensis TaxID=152371 RepID=A0AAP0KXE4_9MAGN